MIHESQTLGKPARIAVYAVLVTMASYEDGKHCKIGELITTLDELAGYTGLKKGAIRRALDALCNRHLISEYPAPKPFKGRLIKVRDFHGIDPNEEYHMDVASTDNLDTRHHKKNKLQEQEKDLSTSDPSGPTSTHSLNFEQIYQAYPRKEGKQAGMRTCVRKIKSQEDYQALQRSVRNFAQLKAGEEKRFIPLFSTFMNSKWQDYIEIEQEESAKPKSIEEIKFR